VLLSLACHQFAHKRFVASGDAPVAVSVQAIVHIINHDEPKKNEILLAIAGTSVIILTWSCAIKWSLSKVLQSSAMRKDAITSGAVAAMAATMLVSTAVYKSHKSVWWLDSAVALLVSFILSLLGLKTLMTHSWWRKDFWFDGVVPPEEAAAQDIMRNPFRKQHHAADAGAGGGVPEDGSAQNYMAEVQMQSVADGNGAHEGQRDRHDGAAQAHGGSAADVQSRPVADV
jgi:hypothetical protein